MVDKGHTWLIVLRMRVKVQLIINRAVKYKTHKGLKYCPPHVYVCMCVYMSACVHMCIRNEIATRYLRKMSFQMTLVAAYTYLLYFFGCIV